MGQGTAPDTAREDPESDDTADRVGDKGAEQA